MATLERDFDRTDVGGAAAPRLVTTHPVLFLLLVYLLLVGLAALALRGFGALQGNPDDPRHWQTAGIFAVILAFPFVRSLRHALRRPRLPAAPRRR